MSSTPAPDIEQEARALIAAEEAARLDRTIDQVRDRHERQRRAAETRAALETLGQRLAAVDHAPVQTARDRLMKATASYVSAATTYNAELQAIRESIRDLGTLPDHTPGPVPGLPASDGDPVSIGQVVRGMERTRSTIEGLGESELLRGVW